MVVKPIPEGYHSVTPYLTVSSAEMLLDFVKQAFQAEETVKMDGPDGKVAHAEVRIGNSIVMIGNAPSAGEAMPAMIYLYVDDDVDKLYRRALEAGATSLEEPNDVFYGDRRAGVTDPVGDKWYIAKHVKDPTPEEMEQGAQQTAPQQS